MTRFNKHSIWLLLLAAGCASVSAEPASLPEPVSQILEESVVDQVDYAAIEAAITQPKSVLTESSPDSDPVTNVELLATPPIDDSMEEGLRIESLEQMALMSNPSVGQAAARVRALRGKFVQVGLPPNPSVG